MKLELSSMSLLCLVSLLLSCMFCVSGRAAERSGSSRVTPFFSIHYYPYTVSLCRTTAEPAHDFSGWDDERMGRDLAMMGTAGIDIVIVSINPEEVSDFTRSASYLEFIRRAGADPAFPKVAFMAESHGATREQIAAFIAWCEECNLERLPGYFQYEGKPLLVIYDAINDRFAASERLTVRHTVWCQEWYWGVAPTPAQTELSRNGEQAMVFAGFLNNGDVGPSAGWSLDRRGGETLRERIGAALALKPKFVCIASWNDFWEGHFIEPNSLDGSQLYDALKDSIGHARRERGRMHAADAAAAAE